MKTFIILIAIIGNLAFAKKIDLIELKKFSMACTLEVVPWIYDSQTYNNSKAENDPEKHAFSYAFDELFRTTQKNAYKEDAAKNLSLAERSEKEKILLAKLTNLLLQEQKSFMQDCVKLYKRASSKCAKFSENVFKKDECADQYLNQNNFTRIRVHTKIN